MILGVLPYLALALASAAMATRLGEGSWRRGVLRAVLSWAVASIFSTELLSLVGGLNRISMGVIWGAASLILLVVLLRRLARAGLRVDGSWLREWAQPWPMGAGVVIVLLGTGLVAWFAPPSTWDSLNYHMPRIAHWAQMGAVRHFSTGIEIQNSMSPGAEMLILPSYLLAGGDRWVNFVSWLAFLGSLIGVSLIAGLLGAGRRGQWAAVIIAATLPTALIQASSTMTDAVVSLWVVVVAVEFIHLLKSPRFSPSALFPIGLAAGLAILTKPTAYAFLLPFALALAVLLFRRLGWRKVLLAASLGVALVGAVNFGHWSRNYRLYGSPISQRIRIDAHRSPLLGGRAFLSNLLRNVALHAGTPSPHFNKAVTLVVQEIHGLLDLDVNDPRTTATGQFKVRWSSTNEDKATNPIHALLILGALVGWYRRRKRFSSEIPVYMVVVISGLLAFSLLFKWQLYAGRYHLPFFTLMAPFIAIVGEKVLGGSWLMLASVGLVLLAWPWLFQIKSRPLLTWPGETYVGSVLTTDRKDLYFANGPYLERPYEEMAALILDSSCRRVGLRISGGQAEYPLWLLLKDAEDPPSIRWIVEGTESAKIRDEGFHPCAIICDYCSGEGDVSGLPLVYRRSGYGLYLDVP